MSHVFNTFEKMKNEKQDCQVGKKIHTGSIKQRPVVIQGLIWTNEKTDDAAVAWATFVRPPEIQSSPDFIIYWVKHVSHYQNDTMVVGWFESGTQRKVWLNYFTEMTSASVLE